MDLAAGFYRNPSDPPYKPATLYLYKVKYKKREPLETKGFGPIK